MMPRAAALTALLLFPLLLPAQDAEQKDLNTALAEASANPLEYLRAIEAHLRKYPDSPRRVELERAAARAAMEAHSNADIIRWGERILLRQGDDLSVLDAVTQALLAAGSPEVVQRAARYARRYQEICREPLATSVSGAAIGVAVRSQADLGIGHGLVLEARATEALGNPQAALALARQSFEMWPDAESAREVARCAEKLGKLEDAVRALADAFTIPDPRSNDADRAADRGHMGQLYRRLKGSEAGLGDLVLEAYDRNQTLVHARVLRLQPAESVTDPMARDLLTLDGKRFAMSSMKGKVVVLDFWATWCVPCREQHPLYEKVREAFREDARVVFLSVNGDDERNRVRPFLTEEKWPGEVYFADGMDGALSVNSFPTTLVLDRHGKVYSRLTGFVPERFVETLTGRIRAALETQ